MRRRRDRLVQLDIVDVISLRRALFRGGALLDQELARFGFRCRYDAERHLVEWEAARQRREES